MNINVGPNKIDLSLTTCLLSADGSDTIRSRQDVKDSSPEIQCEECEEGQGNANLGPDFEPSQENECDSGNSR